MDIPAIRATNISKRYRIGIPEKGYTTFREAIYGFVTSPFKRFQSIAGPISEQDSFWALKDISFEVSSGDTLGIIGRNGAGKSTLLKILSQITEPSAGRIEIKGRIASLLEVGTGFHPELSGRENIYLNGAILGMRREEIRKKFDEIVAFAELDRFLDTPVKRYSSGMYVRLAFAVAAHLEPEVLIVDEVLAVGDAAFQTKCLGKMAAVAGGGRTVLFVSHNLAAIQRLCSRTITLRSGVLVDSGETSGVVDNYLRSCEQVPASSAPRYCRVQGADFVITECAVTRDYDDVILQFEVAGQIETTGIALGVCISTLRGVEVAILRPRKTRLFLPKTLEGYRVSVRCSSLAEQLNGGEYSIGIWLAVPGVERLATFEDACRFSIPSMDPYGYGNAFNSTDDGVLHTHAQLEIAPLLSHDRKSASINK